MNYDKLCIYCMKEKKENEAVCPHCGHTASDYRENGYELPPFTVLNGRYLLGRMIGAGGFGITYIAMDLVLERRVAVKEFFMRDAMYRTQAAAVTVSTINEAQDEMYRTSKAKFEKEAKILAHLNNMPGIVQVHDFFQENGTAYIAMEYLGGKTLGEYVKEKGGRLSVEETKQILFPIMDSLGKIHKEGILHRDISPDNIKFSEDGVLKLFDFGGAKLEKQDGVSKVAYMKPGYTPLEQYSVNGNQGPWTDVYAFGATMYYCICGTRPPEAPDRMSEDKLTLPTKCGVKISKKEESALMKALELSYNTRYQTMEEFKKALEEEKKSSGLVKGGIAGVVGAGIVAVLVFAGKGALNKKGEQKKETEKYESTTEELRQTEQKNGTEMIGRESGTETKVKESENSEKESEAGTEFMLDAVVGSETISEPETLSEEDQKMRKEMAQSLAEISSYTDEELNQILKSNNHGERETASNWNSIKEKIGNFISITGLDCSVSEDGNVYTITCHTKYEKTGDTDVVVTYEQDMKDRKSGSYVWNIQGFSDKSAGHASVENVNSEKETEKLAETQTEKLKETEKRIEIQTAKATEAATEKVTEPPAETETEKVTEAPKETETEKATEAPTETETEEVTETPTETETEEATEPPAETETETEVPAEPETTLEDVVDKALTEADGMIQNGKLDEARRILMQAYNTTKSYKIQDKLDELTDWKQPETKPQTEPETEPETEAGFQSGIHRYEYAMLDGTWEDAYLICKAKGGHLVTFETQEEFDYVTSDLESKDQRGNMFYIGGRRDLSSSDYYWVDADNNLIGDPLNSLTAWNVNCWLTGEPSFRDTTLGLDEHVLDIFYYKDLGRWVWNDVPNDLLSAVSTYRGKIGYICEYED
ncbi:MAG: protein kinase [Lachnospiraceae bacterium]|nr:protein kinase [Lachnospiraceae bacterium]